MCLCYLTMLYQALQIIPRQYLEWLQAIFKIDWELFITRPYTLCLLYIHYVFFLKFSKAMTILLLFRGLLLCRVKNGGKHFFFPLESLNEWAVLWIHHALVCLQVRLMPCLPQKPLFSFLFPSCPPFPISLLIPTVVPESFSWPWSLIYMPPPTSTVSLSLVCLPVCLDHWTKNLSGRETVCFSVVYRSDHKNI